MFTSRRILILLITVILAITFYSCDQEVSTSPPEPVPPQGFIFVNSQPVGFKIYLDGRFTGRFTPDSVPFVEETFHNVTLKRELWRDTSFIVEAKEEELAELDVNYYTNPKMYGSIKFVTQPSGAQIIFNDSLLTETTPFTLDHILPGRYKVSFLYPEHRSNSAAVAVNSNKTSTVSLALKDTSIWVDLNKFTTPIPTDYLVDVSVDSKDVVWIGTVDKGVIRHSGKSWRIYNSSNSQLPNDRIKILFADSKNNIWIGTERGLARIDDEGVMSVYTKSNSEISNEHITDINEDSNGNIWIGTLNGLMKYRNGSFTIINYYNSNMPRKGVTAIEPISEFDLWVALDSIVTRFNGVDDFTIYPLENNDIPNTKISGIDIDAIGNTWAVFTTQFIKGFGNVSGGLGFFDNNWNSILIGGTSLQLNNIFIDSDDIKWISSSDGLFKFSDLNTSEALRPSNSGILSLNIRDVVEDSKGTLWIATGDGLAKYKKQLVTK